MRGPADVIEDGEIALAGILGHCAGWELAAVPQMQGGNLTVTFSDILASETADGRPGDTTRAATVDYASSDDSDPALMVSCAPPSGGVATSRCDFTTAVGTLRFAAGETSKTFVVLISQDAYIEGPEAFPVALSNLTGGAVFAAPSTAAVTINDVQPPVSPANVIDVADIFVKQHYRDFLNREADAPGLAFWTDQITSCGSNAACIEIKRIHVSAAFFLSIEYQETGGYAIRMQRAAFGKKSQDSTRISYLQFINDARFVGDGVVIGQPGADARLNANKDAYATQVVTSTAFTPINFSVGSGATVPGAGTGTLTLTTGSVLPWVLTPGDCIVLDTTVGGTGQYTGGIFATFTVQARGA